jgi:hypothetical protein
MVFFGIIVIVGILVGLALWIKESVVPNWSNPNSVGAKLTKWWNGFQKQKTITKGGKETKVVDANNLPVMEQVPGAKHKIMQKPGSLITSLIIMFITPLFVLLFLRIVGDIGASIIIGLLALFFAYWFNGWKIQANIFITGFGVFAFCWIFPEVLIGTIKITAWIFLILGGISYVLERATSDDVNCFPWIMLHACIFLVIVNILQATLDGVMGHHEYELDILKLIQGSSFSSSDQAIRIFESGSREGILEFLKQNLFAGMQSIYFEAPAIKHVYAEGSRAYLIGLQLFEALQYFVAGLIILTLSLPGELMQYWKRRESSGKKEPLTLTKVAVYDAAVEIGLGLISWFRMKRSGGQAGQQA